MKNYKSKKAFTLMESLIALSIAASASIIFIDYTSEKRSKIKSFDFVNDVVNIVNAVDSRLSIDGYSTNKWGKTEWINESKITKELLKKELISTKSRCEGGTWVASVDFSDERNLVSCGLWNKRKHSALKMNASLNVDSFGFIKSFDFIFSFKNSSDFNNSFLNVKNAIREITQLNKKEKSGLHVYSFIDLSNKNEITSIECSKKAIECGIKGTIKRTGGAEYIRADGSNNMLNSHLSFIDSKGGSIMKCIRWTNDNKEGTGVWKRSMISDKIECGIGIYEGTPLMIETIADTGTFKNIVLDRECKSYQWNGTTTAYNGKDYPCGYTNDGNEIYQVVENTLANTAIYSELNVGSGYANFLTIEDAVSISNSDIGNLTSPLVNANFVEITGLFKLEKGHTFKQEVEVLGQADFIKNVTFESTSIVYFKNQATFEDNLKIDNLILDKELVVNRDSSLENLTARNIRTNKLEVENNILTSKDLNIENKITFNEDLKVNGTLTVKDILSSGSNPFTKGGINATDIVSKESSADISMSAPIGEFDNITKELKDLKTEIDNL